MIDFGLTSGNMSDFDQRKDALMFRRRRRIERKLALSLLAGAVLAPLAVGIGTATAPAASAEVNPPRGTDVKPVLGWSSWSFYRKTTDAADVEAQAKAMRSSGLEAEGYQYINLDDFWYQCPGSQGPNVDQYGRWVTDATRFPAGPDGQNGIAAVAGYVHKLGEEFGIYVTPGISDQAVTANTLVKGTSYTAGQIATGVTEANYNCNGMQGINYSSPGAQAYVDSIVDEYASWGVDYIKLDGITDDNGPDIEAWSKAIRQSGRPMQLDITEGEYTTTIAPAIDQYATQFEYSPDVEEGGHATNGLTDYASIAIRFDTLALWQQYSGSRVNTYDDFDSVEVGNGTSPASATNPFGSVSYPDGDGLTPDERQTVLSLWSLGASPLILGTDLTHLDPLDLSYLKNRRVLAVDQDGIAASRVADTSTSQVIAKTERGGDVVVGLFNTTASPETVSTTASAIGLPARPGYAASNLWANGKASKTGPAISATVPAHGVVLLRIRSA
jgi:Alpha galactosidase C-terminal beta sandwich domain/Alpha galactosidase A